MTNYAHVLNFNGETVSPDFFLNALDIKINESYHEILNKNLEGIASPLSFDVLNSTFLHGLLGNYSKKAENISYIKENFGEFSQSHLVNGLIVSKNIMLILFEEAYARYFQKSPEVIVWLCENFENVIDNSESNIASGLDYGNQEIPNSNHFQDIAIRRVLKSINRTFSGKDMLRARNVDKTGGFLSPGQLEFYSLSLLPLVDVAGWWRTGSLEHFYQSSKIAVVSNIPSPEDTQSLGDYTFCFHKDKIYYIRTNAPRLLQYITQHQFKDLRKMITKDIKHNKRDLK